MDKKNTESTLYKVQYTGIAHKSYDYETSCQFIFELDVEKDEIVKITLCFKTRNKIVYPSPPENRNRFAHNVGSELMCDYLQHYQFSDFPDLIKNLFAKITVPNISYYYRGKGFVAKTLGDIANNIPPEVLKPHNKSMSIHTNTDTYMNFLFSCD